MSLSLSKSSKFNAISSQIKIFPELIIFDLDMCLWLPETYTLNAIPDESCKIIGKLGMLDAEGVIGIQCGYEQLRLFPGALKVLQDYVLGQYGNSIKLGLASSADTPKATQIAYKSLDLLEVIPGMTVRQVIGTGWPGETLFQGNVKIGRSPPLSKYKALTHFPLIQKETGILYDKMLYFDDCNWDDHCSQVESKCPGVVTQRTPNGLQESEFLNALIKYQQKYQS